MHSLAPAVKHMDLETAYFDRCLPNGGHHNSDHREMKAREMDRGEDEAPNESGADLRVFELAWRRDREGGVRE